MRNIIFIAPPAAGKGTVSDYLVNNYGYQHISTGDILREEQVSGSELGSKLKSIMASGALVSDEVMIELISSALAKLDSDKPFILDGFPRTLNQAEKLEEMLVSREVTNNVVIYLNVDRELALKRIVGRLNCPVCKKSYNIYFPEVRPKVANQCDKCMVELIKRDDDNEESFTRRYDAYMREASKIIEFYKAKNLLREVKVGEINKLYQDVVSEVSL